MTIKNIFGYILIIVGIFFAVQSMFGIYAFAISPPVPHVGTFIYVGLIFVILPLILAWLAVSYGRKMIA